METQKIYKVTTEGDCEGRSTKTLGYATGIEIDILNYFDDKKEHSISLYEIFVLHITHDSVKERNALIKEKKELEERIKYINSII